MSCTRPHSCDNGRGCCACDAHGRLLWCLLRGHRLQAWFPIHNDNACCPAVCAQGAPNWFNMLYRLIRPQLSPSTRAKVQVGAAGHLAWCACTEVSLILCPASKTVACTKQLHTCGCWNGCKNILPAQCTHCFAGSAPPCLFVVLCLAGLHQPGRGCC